MANDLKNLMPLGGNWLVEVIEEDPVNLETYLHNGDANSKRSCLPRDNNTVGDRP
jgi:hypothetical protein